MKIWLKLTKYSQVREIGSLSTFTIRAVFMFLNNFVFLTFWWILFRNVDHLYGATLSDILLLWGICSLAFGFAMVLFAGFTEIPTMIKTGELDRFALFPRSTLGLVCTSKSEPSAWGDIVSGVVILALCGQISWYSAPMIAFAVLTGTLVITAFGTIIYSLAFFFPNTEEGSFRIWETLITLSLYPDRIFSNSFRIALFTVIPASLIGNLPIEAIKSADPSILLSVALATASLAGIAVFTFRCGVDRFVRGR